MSLLLLLLAYWPVWLWYFSRTFDGSDEPWGLLALVTALGYCLVAAHQRTHGEKRPALVFDWLQVSLVLGYCLCLVFAPMQITAMFALTSLGVACARMFLGRVEPGFLSLLLLSLPVVSSMQFFLGYPLRILVSKCSAPMLEIAGFAVQARATALVYEGRVFEVDAPCSGIRMLWSALFVAALLICFRKLSWRSACIIFAVTIPVVVLGNVLRASSLFIAHSAGAGRMLNKVAPNWHSDVGVVCFALCAGAIWLLCGRFKSMAPQAKPAVSIAGHHKRLICCAVLAALMPRAVHTTAAQVLPASFKPVTASQFPGWPVHFENRSLRKLTLTAVEKKFQSGFPGRIGRFSDGERQVVVRWIEKETRQLHPSSECFRGAGFSITPLAMRVDADGRRWQCFRAESMTNRLLVREMICDEKGNHWSDVSHWYWAALLGRTHGPWWAYTIAEPANRIKSTLGAPPSWRLLRVASASEKPAGSRRSQDGWCLR